MAPREATLLKTDQASSPAGSSAPEMALALPPSWWLLVGVAILLLGLLYFDSLQFMVGMWVTDENYGHGMFVPLISGYLIWQQRNHIQWVGAPGTWWGLPLLGFGLACYVIGELGTLYVLLHLSLWLVLVGLIVSIIGPRGAREIAFPLFFLLTMIPLPEFLHQALSSRLQLLSSALGVGCLQLIGVTAFRDGNVIDLGPIQLQVVEACSGLRYFLPLTSLALLCAYLFQDRLWKRLVLFFSSVPLAVLLNGFRIGVIGLLVDVYGQGAAEGFLHFFEGWIFFVASLGLLFGEMLILSRIDPMGGPMSVPMGVGRSWRTLISLPGALYVSAPASPSASSQSGSLRDAPTFLLSLSVLGLAALASPQLVGRTEVVPVRESFLDFPMVIGDWHGSPVAMEKQYVEKLRLDDYLLADYQKPGQSPIDLYIAYYRSQRKGQSVHSPKTCLPGGGWEMASLRTVEVEGASPGAPSLMVNRAVIQKGDQKQLVFYWLKQRERLLTDEYLVKAFVFWDALTRQRTDGALVRLITAVRSEADEAAADRRLHEFANLVHPMLKRYVPD